MQQSFTRRCLQHAASLPAYAALHAANLSASIQAENQFNRTPLYTEAPAVRLTPAETSVVNDVADNGLAMTSIGALGLDTSRILAHGREMAAQVAARGSKRGAEYRTTLTSKPDDLLGHPDVYRWGLHPAMLRIAAAYLGTPVGYDGALLFHTVADGREHGTRMWHLDREDRRVLKVGLYLTDVDEGSGPFQMIGRRVATEQQRFSYPVLTDAEMRVHLAGGRASRDPITCTGPAGTLVFAETAQFYHRGMPAVARDRDAIFFSYFSQPPRHPFFCGRSRLKRHQIARLVQDMTPEQQASALWRDELRWTARLVPVSRV